MQCNRLIDGLNTNQGRISIECHCQWNSVRTAEDRTHRDASHKHVSSGHGDATCIRQKQCVARLNAARDRCCQNSSVKVRAVRISDRADPEEW